MLLLRQNIASEVRTLLKETAALRRPKLGVLAKDRTKSPKLTMDRYVAPYEVKFPPVRLHVVEDVTITDWIYATHREGLILDHHIVARIGNEGQMIMPDWLSARASSSASEQKRDFPRAEDVPTLVVHNEGGGTWGHWIVQNLPKVLLFLQHYPEGKVALPQRFLDDDYSFGCSLGLYGIHRTAIAPITPAGLFLPTAVFIDHLYHDHAVHPAALDLLSAFKVTANGSEPSRMFIGRANRSPKRNIENIDEIVAEAGAFGFQFSALGAASVEEQAANWSQGSQFISTLGSDLTNVVFAKNSADVLCISPDFHGDVFFFDLAAAKGLTWHELLCGAIVHERNPRHYSSFSVDPVVFRQFVTDALGS